MHQKRLQLDKNNTSNCLQSKKHKVYGKLTDIDSVSAQFIEALMKEVKFRWIDQYLIHMTLKTKFAILALVPMLMIVGFSVFLNNQFQQTLLDNHLATLQTSSQKINQVAGLL
jgi:hypothetical protein